jgi:hypothetical protein
MRVKAMADPGNPYSYKAGPPNLHSLNPKPTPIAGMCNPLCPYFKCGIDSLQAFKVNRRGIVVTRPHCLALGDKCVGLKCRYSHCTLLAAGADGRCSLATINPQGV